MRFCTFAIFETVKLPLEKAKLKGIRLGSAKFRRMSMAGVQLQGEQMASAEFLDVDLSRANLAEAGMRGVKLVGVDLSGAMMRKAVLDNGEVRRLKGVDGASFADASTYRLTVDPRISGEAQPVDPYCGPAKLA